LAGGIAHDFNNLLYPIIGYTEMTLKSMPEGSPARSNLEEVLKAAGRAQDLIQQFLNFNYHGQNKLKPLRIQCIIKEVLNFLRATQPNTIEIFEDINEKCGFVLADPTQLHRIIMNLCTNACQAMLPSGGILEVSLGEIHIGAENSFNMGLEPGNYLRLTVRDTGKGIDSAVINRIFDPFFTTKEENKGAGLGLFVVLGIVKGYGGNISVSSALNKGTVIDVYLPGIDVEDKHWRQIQSTDMAEEKITVEEFREVRKETTLNMPA
jgi:signal transduction histidine kinase